MVKEPVDSPRLHRDKSQALQVSRYSRNHYERIGKAPKSFFPFSILFRVFFIIMLCVLLISFVWRLRGTTTTLSFTGFLEWLSNLNNVEIDLGLTNFTIGGDWGWFEFFRNFLNVFTSIFTVLVWLFTNLVNVCLYLISFLRFIFVG